MKIVNLTQHDVNVINENNETITFKPSGNVARVQMTQEPYGMINGFKVYKKIYGKIDFGTEIEPYTLYIVSNEIIKALNQARHPLTYQFVAPNTVKSVRGNNGAIDKVHGFMI